MGNSNSSSDSPKDSKSEKQDGGSLSPSPNAQLGRDTLQDTKSSTNSDVDRKTLFKAANDGTVVLQTVPVDTSAKLLHQNTDGIAQSTKIKPGETILDEQHSKHINKLSISDSNPEGFVKPNLSSSEGTSVDHIPSETVSCKPVQMETGCSDSSDSDISDSSTKIGTDIDENRRGSIDKRVKVQSDSNKWDRVLDSSDTSSSCEKTSYSKTSVKVADESHNGAFDRVDDPSVKTESSSIKPCKREEKEVIQTDMASHQDPEYSKNVKHAKEPVIKDQRKKKHSHKAENLMYSTTTDSDSSIIEVSLERDSVNSLEGENMLQSKPDLGQTYTISTCLQKTETVCRINKDTQKGDCENVCMPFNETPQVSSKNSSDYNAKESKNKEMSSTMTETSLETSNVLETEENEIKTLSIGCNLPGLGMVMKKSHPETDKTPRFEDVDISSETKVSGELRVNNETEIVQSGSQINKENNNNNMTVNQCMEIEYQNRDPRHTLKQDSLVISEQSGFTETSEDMNHGEKDFPERDTNTIISCSNCNELCQCNNEIKEGNRKTEDSCAANITDGIGLSLNISDLNKQKETPGLMPSHLVDKMADSEDGLDDDPDLSEINRILCTSGAKEEISISGITRHNHLKADDPLKTPQNFKMDFTDSGLVYTNNEAAEQRESDADSETGCKTSSSATQGSGKLITVCLDQLENQDSKDSSHSEVDCDRSSASNNERRSYLSFAGLVSVHTLGEESTDGVKMTKKGVSNKKVPVKSEPDSPVLKTKTQQSNKQELVTEKIKGGSLGSGRKGRSRRSHRVLPQQVKEYWHQHLAKYSTVSDRGHGGSDNLRDITNFDLLRHMGTKVGGKNKGSALCASDGDLNASSQEYHKYSKFAQANNPLARSEYGDYTTPVCSSSTGLINRWSSNLSLQTDSPPLIHEDSEKRTASSVVDRQDSSQQEQGEREKEISKNDTLNTHNESEEACVKPIKTDIIISSERLLQKVNVKQTTGDLQVEQKSVKRSVDTNDVISICHNDKDNSSHVLKDKVKEKLVCGDFAEKRSNTSSPCGSVRSDTESPSSLSLSVVTKPPSGVKKKKEITTPNKESRSKTPGKASKIEVNKSSRDSNRGNTNTEKEVRSVRRSTEREKKKERKGNVTKDQGKGSPLTHKGKGKQSSSKTGMTKGMDEEFEAKMLKTLISNTTSLPKKSEDEIHRKQPLSRSWSGNDFKTESSSAKNGPEQQIEETSSPTEKGAEGIKKTKMRRTMSDLGFAPTRPNRTASLLRNPVMRKHLARTMGLNPEASEEDIKEAIDEKLETTMKQNNLGMGRSSSTMSLSSRRFEDGDDGGNRQFHSKLCRTSSLSDGINSHMNEGFQKNNASNSGNTAVYDKGLTAESPDIVFAQNKKEDAVVKNVQETLVFRSNRVRSASDRNLSGFQIPSFNEFRRSKRLGVPLKSRSSSCFDCIADETIIEEDIQDPNNPDGKSVVTVPRGNRYSDQSYHRDRVNSLSSINKLSKGRDFLQRDKVQTEVKAKDTTNSQTDNIEQDIEARYLSQNSNSSTLVQDKKSSSTSSHHNKDKKIEHVIGEKHSNKKSSKFYQDVPPCPNSPDQALGDELEHGLDSDTSLHMEELRREKSKGHNMRAHHWKKREDKFRKKFFPDQEGFVNRSTSDVSDIKAEEDRKKGVKDKRQKLYKSDPFGNAQRKCRATGFEGDEIKEELLNLVKDVQSCSQQSLESNFTAASSVPSLDSCLDDMSSDDKPNPVPPPRRKSKRRKKKKEGNSSNSPEKKEPVQEQSSEEKLTCHDCDTSVDQLTQTEATPGGSEWQLDGTLCVKCVQKREERRRIIDEILLTETRYGKDLKIIHKEFYVPLRSNGLLSDEQVATIFINLEELITINEHFVKKLEDLLGKARGQGDQDLFHIDVGRLFLHSTNMLLAFETYCIDHSEALVALETLEKEKEILRIFLEVSQAENSALRRMHLKAFLMVPVQRIMKYPLLLHRLYKLTTVKHRDREDIKTAKKKIEDILEHINYKTKGTASIRFRRSAVQQMKKNIGIYEDLEIHKMFHGKLPLDCIVWTLSYLLSTLLNCVCIDFCIRAACIRTCTIFKIKVAMETVGWNKNEINIVYSGKLLLGNMPDMNATKRNKLVKFTSLQAVLLTLGKGPTWETGVSEQSFPLALQTTPEHVKNCALVILKEKAGTYTPYREPYYLDKCIIAMDEDIPEIFEVQEMSRLGETYVCKAMDHRDTVMWYNHLKFQCHGLGKWRKRRNAMPNIMIELGKT